MLSNSTVYAGGFSKERILCIILISCLVCVCVCVFTPQDLLYVWTEPKLCMGGVALPEKKTLPCEGMEYWVRLGAGLGAFTAVLLVSLTCYFWKKNKRYDSLFNLSFLSPFFPYSQPSSLI